MSNSAQIKHDLCFGWTLTSVLECHSTFFCLELSSSGSVLWVWCGLHILRSRSLLLAVFKKSLQDLAQDKDTLKYPYRNQIPFFFLKSQTSAYYVLQYDPGFVDAGNGQWNKLI